MARPKDDHSNQEKAQIKGEYVNVASRVMSTLEAVVSGKGELSTGAIASKLRLPKASVHRICMQLEAEGYLQRSIGRKYFTAGSKLWNLGYKVINIGYLSERRAIIQKLVDVIEETSNLSMLVGNKSMYIDRIESRWPLRMNLDPGATVPLHCTASGKLFLSEMPAARRAVLLSGSMSAETDKTITTLAEMEKEILRINERDYAMDDEEFIEGLFALAVPIRNQAGNIVAGLACHGPKPRWTPERALAFLPQMRLAAQQLQSILFAAPKTP